MRFFSLEGKLALLLVALLLAGAAAGYGIATTPGAQPWMLALALFALVAVAVGIARLIALPLAELFRTLTGAVASFRDGDFSFSIHADRRDELGELIAAHNELGRVLRDERQNLFQRELLLHTVVQNTPTALVLADPNEHVVYSNTAARQLFNSGRRMEGLAFGSVVAECPAALANAVASGQDAIVSVVIDGGEESFHTSQRRFQLNGREHKLYLFKRLTRELSRQEVATWKKVIRVISHELNNSLAPISSLAHSGRELAASGRTERLAQVFDTIEERSRHLDAFIRGYAAFAKLPTPQIADVDWAPFLERLAEHSGFTRVGNPPAHPGRFDPAQLSQVLINLLKNAHESGSPPEAVELEVREIGADVRIEVRDRGAGMTSAVMANALVPFYSTKRSGTGLGLALAREIVEAHGGRINLANREDGGLTVTLWLPRRPVAEPAAGPS